MGSCCVPSLYTTDWPEAAMRGHSMALSSLWAALLIMVVTGVVRGQDYSGTMQCQCECANDCTSGDPVTVTALNPLLPAPRDSHKFVPLTRVRALLECHQSALEVEPPQRPQQQQQQRQRRQHCSQRLLTLGKLSVER